ncbi:hypothetical protein AB0M20_32775 [Actinoplanes sp. NPDC051633]|uniref:hypothetical protein n=1 Tax=Actinoplanes sp. NPDC051633 TaxID=3155670 RepID=UPI00343D957F
MTTTMTAMIPRIRIHRCGRVVAIRCATCRTWRKPRQFLRNASTCRRCPTGRLGRYLTRSAAQRR